jgi:hypothetical protein
MPRWAYLLLAALGLGVYLVTSQFHAEDPQVQIVLDALKRHARGTTELVRDPLLENELTCGVPSYGAASPLLQARGIEPAILAKNIDDGIRYFVRINGGQQIIVENNVRFTAQEDPCIAGRFAFEIYECEDVDAVCVRLVSEP